MLHSEEIAARPPRTWHQTETQKKLLREANKEIVKQELDAAR